MGSFDKAVPLSEGDQRKSTLNKGPHALGTQGETDDGRVYRYVKNGGVAMAPGKLYQRTLPVAAHTGLVIPAAVAAGVQTVVVTNATTAITKDQFKGGWLGIEDDTGEGYNYLIESNTADSTTTGPVTVVIADPNGLKLGITTSTTVSLTTNKYDSVIVHPSPPTAATIGVATHAAPASYYCWVQTKGECAVLVDTAITAAKAVMASTAVDGSVILYTTGGDDEEIVGVTVRNATDTEYGLVDLRLE